jgi:hypothetical protein
MTLTHTIAFAVSLAVFGLGGYVLRDFKRDQVVSVTSASKKPPKLCVPTASCENDVTVVFDDCPNNCFPAVLFDVLVVKGGTKITWTVKHANFKFANNGIVFDSSSGIACSANGAKKFDCTTGASSDPTKVGTFKYTINLEAQSGTNHPPPLDPFVVNN